MTNRKFVGRKIRNSRGGEKIISSLLVDQSLVRPNFLSVPSSNLPSPLCFLCCVYVTCNFSSRVRTFIFLFPLFQVLCLCFLLILFFLIIFLSAVHSNSAFSFTINTLKIITNTNTSNTSNIRFYISSSSPQHGQPIHCSTKWRNRR